MFNPFKDTISALFSPLMQSKSAQTLGAQSLMGLCSIHSLSYREAIMKALQQQSPAVKATLVEVTSLVKVKVGVENSLEAYV